jgi:hypothetical protein
MDSETEAWATSYIELKKEIAFDTTQANALKAQILERIKDANKVIGKTCKISAGIVNKKEYVVKASSTRQLRVSDTTEK